MTAGSPPPRPPRGGPAAQPPGRPERLRDPRRSDPRRSDPRRGPGTPPGRPTARTTIRSAQKIPSRPGYAKPPPRPRPPRPRPRRLIPRANPVRRLGITLLAIAFVLTLFAARLVQLQGLQAGPYGTLASQQRAVKIGLPALRGTITGANGEVLAMTVATYLVYADPPEIPAAQQPQVAAKLATYLGQLGRGDPRSPPAPDLAAVRGAGQERARAGGQRDRRRQPARHRAHRELRQVIPERRFHGRPPRLHRHRQSG